MTGPKKIKNSIKLKFYFSKTIHILETQNSTAFGLLDHELSKRQF